MKSFFFNMIIVLYFFSFSSNVEAINCYSCEMTTGWMMMDGGDWGENGCNDFSQNMTAYPSSAQNCSSGVPENNPGFCFTKFESFDQEDFSGVRENRGCDSDISRGNIDHIICSRSRIIEFLYRFKC